MTLLGFGELLLSGFVTFVAVFFKGFQTKNVIGNHRKMVALFSFLMAAMDVIAVGLTVRNGFANIVPNGIGAAIGMIAAMYSHDRWMNK